MTTASHSRNNPQLAMPGMPRPTVLRRVLSPASVTPGQEVEYQGRISGGPRFGMKGKIVQTRTRQAVVDLGPAGTWHIPYYFLAIPQAA